MISTSLIAEFLVIGLFPFFTIAFAVLLIIGVYDLGFLAQVKDYSLLLSIWFALSVYLLGALTHRLSQLVNVRSLRFLWKLAPLESLGQIFAIEREKWRDDYYLLYQYGSDNLCAKITYNESLHRVFKSVALTAPILAIVLAIWLSKSVGWPGALIAMAACLLVSLAAVVATPIQYQNYRQLIEFSADIIRKYGPTKKD